MDGRLCLRPLTFQQSFGGQSQTTQWLIVFLAGQVPEIPLTQWRTGLRPNTVHSMAQTIASVARGSMLYFPFHTPENPPEYRAFNGLLLGEAKNQLGPLVRVVSC